MASTRAAGAAESGRAALGRVTDDGRVRTPTPLDRLTELVAAGDVTVLSGAGLSTESGIPDYRGPTGLARATTPMTYQEFTRDPAARQRYWARSHVGWRVIDRARPNDGHRAVASLQGAGLLTGIVTQNVDGLHGAAGARDVVELHGNLEQVTCLQCGDLSSRAELATRLAAANPGWAGTALAVNPDGDVRLADVEIDAFSVVPCARLRRGAQARRRVLR